MRKPIDLSHHTSDGSFRPFTVAGLLVAGVILAGLIGFASTLSSPKPHCPDGYSLAGGGGFAGPLHCQAGPPVEWR